MNAAAHRRRAPPPTRAPRLIHRAADRPVLCRLIWITLATLDCGEAPAVIARAAEPTTAMRPEPTRGRVPHDARIADYRIDARLDTDEHRIDGTVEVTWHNRTHRPVRRLRFHQYMNAFRADDTVWLAEGGDGHRGHARARDSWGYLDIRDIRRNEPSVNIAPTRDAGSPSNPPLTWHEDSEPTLLTVDLPGDVGPSESVTLTIEFVTQLPEVFARTGHSDGFYLVAQWYPKLAVFDASEGWRAHPFTYHSEFFADFGTYEVRLDVPDDLIVGATGIRTGETHDAGRNQLAYRAEMVHDFAWTASPGFTEHSTTVDGIRVRLLSSGTDKTLADEHLATQVAALDSYQTRFGPYPWSTITIVEPPNHAAGAGGMEYPTFYTTSAARSRRRLPAWVLEERLSGTFTTLHEFGHQYFQGMLASDEYREPWLDEGLNTTSNVLALYDRYGQDAWVARLFGHALSMDDVVRLGMHDDSPVLPVRSGANEFQPFEGSYHRVVYEKTAAVMLTLRNLLGAAKFDAALHRYAQAHRFAHPSAADLERAFLDEVGERPRVATAGDIRLDLRAFFASQLRGTNTVNFAVKSVENSPRRVGAGWHRDANDTLVLTPTPDNADDPSAELPDNSMQGQASLTREGKLPVEVEIEFVDGRRRRFWWITRERFAIHRFPGQRVRRVTLDPDRRYLIETHLHDNTAQSDEQPGLPTAAERLGTWSELLALFLVQGVVQ